jgi:uncharacterized membrane protein YfcA
VLVGVILLGFGVGVLTGATGIGGGTLMAPALIFILRMNPFVSVGTDLFVSVLTKAVGSFVFRKTHNTIPEISWPLCIAGAIGAAVAGLLLWLLKSHVDMTIAQAVLRRVIGYVLLLCAAAIALSWGERWRGDATGKKSALGAAGAVIAALTTITGVGVGSLSVPTIYLMSRGRPMAAVVGTSLFFGMIVTLIASLAHIALGDVDYGLSLWLLLGAIPGVALGSLFAIRGSAILRPVVVLLIIVSAVRLIM